MDRYEPGVTLQIDAGLQAEASSPCQPGGPQKSSIPQVGRGSLHSPPPPESGEQSPAEGGGREQRFVCFLWAKARVQGRGSAWGTPFLWAGWVLKQLLPFCRWQACPGWGFSPADACPRSFCAQGAVGALRRGSARLAFAPSLFLKSPLSSRRLWVFCCLTRPWPPPSSGR